MLLKVYLLLVSAMSLIQTSSGVDRTKFKTCEQSSFCQRNRNHKPFEQDWKLQMSTVRIDGNDVIGQLVDQKNPSVELLMRLSLTQRGAIRMKVDQVNPTRGRWEPKEALDPNLSFSPLRIEEHTNEKLTLVFGSYRPDRRQEKQHNKYRLIFNSSPFQAEVLDSSGETVVLLNSKGLMRFEDHKELSEATKPVQFGAPREAKAYDEAGRPVEENSPADAEAHQEQPQADQQPAETESNEVKSYSETFSTFVDQRPYGPMSVGMDIYFPNSDHVYGIPEHADTFNLKDTRPNVGDPYRLYNVDIFEYEIHSPMSLYGAIPFMISQSKTVGTFGVYWLNPSETWIDIESNSSQSKGAGVVDMISKFVSSDTKMTGRLTHWFSETGLIDVWFMPGPEPQTVVGFNAEAFGTMPLPPVYSTGFHQCRWNYYSGQEVMQVDQGFDNANVPLDAIWLDIEYTAGRSKKYFTWDPIAFANHIELANNLTSKGRRLIAIIDPHIKKEDGYATYDEGTSLDMWVKDTSGQHNYDGWCWPGSSVWPDYTTAKVRDWWASKFDPAHFPGDKNCLVDIWNDMNEPSVFSGPEVTAPRDLLHADGWESRDIHNMYGFLMTKATYEGMAKYRGHLDRPFILTRSFFAGSQRYCSAWTGDNQAKWDHLQITLPMLLSLSVAGMPFVGADVGGFFNNPESEELLVRWHQAGAFQPFFRAHAHHDARHREAYMFQGLTLDLLRNATQMRYSYSPYWYTLFYDAHTSGMPMMRPLWFHEDRDEKTYDIEDQYLLGAHLLVKPVLHSGVQAIDVYLPGGAGKTAWFDLNSHTMHSGGQTVSVPVDVSIVPLFQRAGSVIPRFYRTRRSLEVLMRDPVSLDIVLGDNQGVSVAYGALYVDEFKKLKPDATSSTFREFIYNDHHLHVKASTDASLAHGVVERIIIYNWPVSKRIKTIAVATSKNNYSSSSVLTYRLGSPRSDSTAVLEIKRPQLSSDWKEWLLKIDVAN